MTAGIGFIAQTFDLELTNGTLISPAGELRANAIGLQAGDVVTNIVIDVLVAASGTAPTLTKVGLYDSNLNLLASSADLSASAIWNSIQFAVAALSSPFIVSTAGMYYCGFLRVGNYGTTNPTFRDLPSVGVNVNKLTGKPFRFFRQSGLVDLPNPAVPVTATQSHWFGIT